jgi:hypothetical protein
MKNTVNFFAVIAFIITIAFSMATCGGAGAGNGNYDSGNNNNDNSSNSDNGDTSSNGEEVTLSGRLYYYSKNERFDVSYEEYNGSDLTWWSGVLYGSGKVINGQFSHTLPSLINTNFISGYATETFNGRFNVWNGFYGAHPYIDIAESPAFVYVLERSFISNYHIYREFITANTTSGKSGSRTEERVNYWYVKNDVTVSGKGTTQTRSYYSPYFGNTVTEKMITTDFNIAMKKGWNTVYIKRQISVLETPTPTITFTETISLDNPSHLRWVRGGGYSEWWGHQW